jgi:hypothetical protein
MLYSEIVYQVAHQYFFLYNTTHTTYCKFSIEPYYLWVPYHPKHLGMIVRNEDTIV